MSSCSARREALATKGNVTGPTARGNAALLVMISSLAVRAVESVTSTTLVDAMTLLQSAEGTCARAWLSRHTSLLYRPVHPVSINSEHV